MDVLNNRRDRERRKKTWVCEKEMGLKKEFVDLEKVKNSFNRIYRLLYFDVIV